MVLKVTMLGQSEGWRCSVNPKIGCNLILFIKFTLKNSVLNTFVCYDWSNMLLNIDTKGGAEGYTDVSEAIFPINIFICLRHILEIFYVLSIKYFLSTCQVTLIFIERRIFIPVI